jgi:hypothetical protein
VRMNAGVRNAILHRAVTGASTHDLRCFGRDIRTCLSEPISRPLRPVVHVGGAWS